MTQRTQRIDALLREEIGAILARDVSDPEIGFTTVTRVETAPDLSHAQVWVSLIGQPDERATTLAAFRRALPFIRHLLGQRVRLRRIPELHLRVDDTSERGTRVLHLLAELEAGRIPDEAPVERDPLPTPVPRLGQEPDAQAGPGPDGDGPAPGAARRARRLPKAGPGQPPGPGRSHATKRPGGRDARRRR